MAEYVYGIKTGIILSQIGIQSAHLAGHPRKKNRLVLFKQLPDFRINGASLALHVL